MAKRIAKQWTYNPRYDVESFDLKEVNPNNLVNQMLVLKQSDVTFAFIMELFGEFNGKPMCHHYDTFTVPVGAYKYIDDKGKEVSNQVAFTTTFGIWVFNIFFIRDFGFGKILGYINTSIDKKKFNKVIMQKLVYALMEDKIEVNSYKKFLDYCEFFMPFETVLSPNHNEAILACTKEIAKKKEKLFAEHKAELDAGNAAVAEDIGKELLEFAKEYLKDDPALDPYLSGAGGTLENNFKNMYIMKGAIRDPDPTAKQEFKIAKSSFIDGIAPEEYSMLANSLTGGPYSRAKKTELGGYWEKLVEYAFNTVTLDEPGSDCGTDKYLTITLTNNNVDGFMYSYILKGNGELEELTSENVDKYVGKTVKIRSALFCKSKTGICNKCIGNFLYRRGGKNVGLALANIPSKIKLVSMKAFHDSTVSTVTIDPMRAFSIKK
jgi:hypothetical protein